MNDIGDVEFLLKEIYRIYEDWHCETCERRACLFCPALYIASEIMRIIDKRYGMTVFRSVDSEEIMAKNSVCSISVKRERSKENDKEKETIQVYLLRENIR